MNLGMRYVYLLVSSLLLAMLSQSAWAGQMTLDAAFEKALADNPTLQAMVQRINQSKERITQARASYYPHLALGASATRNQYSDNDLARGAAVNSSQEY